MGGHAKKQWLAFIAMAFLQWIGCFAGYAGIYTGTFSGGDVGTWRMTVNSSGDLKGFLSSDSDTNAYVATGTVATNGTFRFDAIGVDGSGDVSGVFGVALPAVN
jgi:hypothetical protein